MNTIIEINISYKILINYCSLQMHNYYNIEKNFKYNTAISTFSDHFTIFWMLSIDIWQFSVNNYKQIKQKMANFSFCKIFRIIKFFFLILLRRTTLESKVAPTNRNISIFLLHTSSKTFSNVELFLIFSQYFFFN